MRSRVYLISILLGLICNLGFSADHWVLDSQNSVPPFLWTCGCSPTAGIMVLAYWDKYTPWEGWYQDYGKLVPYYFERRIIENYTDNDGDYYDWGSYSDDWNGYDGIPYTIVELARGMDTKADGSTDVGHFTTDRKAGILYVANDICGYDFDAHEDYTQFDWGDVWNSIKEEIENDRPCIWGFSSNYTGGEGHAVCAIGYDDEGNVYFYNTWELGWDYQPYQGNNIDYSSIVTAIPEGGNFGNNIMIISPGGGENWAGGSEHDIIWYQWGSMIDAVTIHYSTDGGYTWNHIVSTSTTGPGENSYSWTAPTISSSDVFVKVRGTSHGDYIASESNIDPFTITSPPYEPSSPSPADGATGVSIYDDLSWSGGDPDGDVTTYDIYFEANYPPDELVSNDQSGTSYDPGILEYGTHYYWKIVATDNHGASTEGPVWDFTTTGTPNNPPYAPSVPLPADGAKNVSIYTNLSWTGGDPDPGDVTTYDVYFEANYPPDELVSNDQSGTSYDPGTLQYGTHYYWKIVATDNHGASTEGPVWDFTTEDEDEGRADMVVSPDTVIIVAGSSTLLSRDVGNRSADASEYQSGIVSVTSTISGIRSEIVLPGFENKQPTGTMTVKNVGTANLEVRDIQTITSWISDINPDSFTVSPGDSSIVTITANAAGCSLGTHYGSVIIFSDDPDEDRYEEPVKLIKGVPTRPSLSHPDSGTTNQPISLTLYWHPSSDATSYRLQVDGNSNFSSPVADIPGVSDTFYYVSDLSENTIYYWRVNASNSYGTSLWSSTWYFTTMGGCDTPPNTFWAKTYGGLEDEEGYSVQQTTDGGYIIVGYTNSFGAGGKDVYLVKTDSLGDTLWTRTYGGANDDVGRSVQHTSDGGYIIAGYTQSFGSGCYVYLIKTNGSGTKQWDKTYGGGAGDFGRCVQQTSDSGYIIVGYTRSFGAGFYDAYVIKTNANGDTLWTRTYGGAELDVFESVQQTSDGGYIIVGYTGSFGAGDDDVYLVKIEPAGGGWAKTYGGADTDRGYSVQQTSDGGHIIAGYTWSFGVGYDDVYLIKTDEEGYITWFKTYGGTNTDRGYSVQQTSDGGYVIAGCTYSFGPSGNNVYLIRTDVNGDTCWTKTYGGPGQDAGQSVQQTSDGGYLVAGYTSSFGAGSSDIWLIKAKYDEPIPAPLIAPEPLYTQGSENTLYWTNTAVEYFCQCSIDSGFTAIFDSSGWIPDTFYNFTGLIDATRYRYRVKARNAGRRESDWSNVVFSIQDASAPKPFSLCRPLDSTWVDTIRPTFEWQASSDLVSGIYQYHTYIDEILIDSVADTMWTPIYYLNEGSYNWYIVACDNAGNYRESKEIWTVGIDTTAPIAPTLISPADGIASDDLTPTFVWGASFDNLSGVDYYILQYADNPNFSDTTTIHTTDTTTYTPASPLPDTTYYWRVKACDRATNQSEWSVVWNFEVDTHAPNMPALISPTDNSCLGDTMVIFEWTGVGCKSQENLNRINSLLSPVRYVLQVDSSSLFIEPIYVCSTVYNKDTVNTAEGAYSWRVEAYDLASNHSGFSSFFSFIVDITAPASFGLSSPTDSSWVDTIRPTFKWNPSSDVMSGINEYCLYIDEVLRDSVADTIWIANYDIDEGYHDWYVIAYDCARNCCASKETMIVGIDTTAPAFDTTIVLRDTSSGGLDSVVSIVIDTLSGIDSVFLRYKLSAGDTCWQTKPMEQTDSLYKIEVGDWDTIAPVNYYVLARDVATNEATDPTGAPESCHSFGIEEQLSTISVPFALYQNCPNPFVLTTVITFALPEESHVRINVYDITGRVVETLINAKLDAGYNNVRWNPKNLAPGIYFYKIQAYTGLGPSSYTETKKMILFK